MVKNVKKTKFTISSKKWQGKKKVYIRVRAYNLNGKSKVKGDWSGVKTIR